MNADEINAALAETQGWEVISWGKKSAKIINPNDPKSYDFAISLNGKTLEEFRLDNAGIFPNYHGSLDAIVPVVRAMPDYKRMKAIMALADICFGHVLCLATPAQWCEAYLRAEGLWK